MPDKLVHTEKRVAGRLLGLWVSNGLGGMLLVHFRRGQVPGKKNKQQKINPPPPPGDAAGAWRHTLP
jgi:hypothetical protein